MPDNPVKPSTENSKRRTVAYFIGSRGILNPNPAGKSHDGFLRLSFYQVRLDASVLAELIPNLRAAATCKERLWHTLTATSENASRLRMYVIRTPDFEMQASKCYLRGTLFRISGRESVNIDFSTDGALLLAERLREAKAKMRSFVLLRVPNRKKDVIEFLPDIELEALHSDEHARLGQAGESIAAQVLGREDFNDWEEETG